MLNLASPSLFVFIASLLISISLPATAQQPRTQDFVPGQLIVGFKTPSDLDKAVTEFEQAEKASGARGAAVQSISVQVQRLNATSAKVHFEMGTRAAARAGPASELTGLEEYANLLRQNPDVAFAHPNWVMDLQRDRIIKPVHFEDLPPDTRVQISSNLPTEPNDPMFRRGLFWHYLPPPVGMNAMAVWPKVKGARDVVVAVIDTGILPNHPDIKGSGNVLPGYDFISSPESRGRDQPGPDADPTDLGDACPRKGIFDPSWHGTHVSGTIGAAATNNNIGIAGVNWAVSVLPVRALGRCGGTIEDLAAAVRWSAGLPVPGVPSNARKADVINLSLGMVRPCSQQNAGLLMQAFNDARQAGATVVVAAGNDAVDIKDATPAGCAGVISVAAADHRGHLTPYSNYGNVTLMAPGGDLQQEDDSKMPYGVWSLVAPSAMYSSGVAAYEGTSMATPHVSAAIAMALSVKPELRGKPDKIEELLITSLAKQPQGACSKPCGPGLLDVKPMVEQAPAK